MNSFLYINRKVIFFLGIALVILFFINIFSKQIKLSDIQIIETKNNISDADISEPKFAINNETKKIYITASEGNFINKDEILLKNNVRFKSNEFSIETDNVIFNRNKQTAQSTTNSIFKSENTSINSEGFNIYDNGNKIIFYGNSYIIIK